MKVLDSNLWVKGTLKTNQNAVDLLAELEDGTITAVLTEYILAETLTAFDRTLTGRTHDQVLKPFWSVSIPWKDLLSFLNGAPSGPPGRVAS